MGKKSLLRTLQTLGSVPNWEIEKTFEDSDEEKDTSAAVQTPKKKRCKKRKRKSNADDEGKQRDEVDSPETPAKKKKPLKKTVKGTSESLCLLLYLSTLLNIIDFFTSICVCVRF